MKIIKTASGKQIKMSKSEWQEIGKTAGWMKTSGIKTGTINTTIYLNDDGLYRLNGDEEKGVDVVIEYDHYDAEPTTYIDPGSEAWDEIVSVTRLDDNIEIENYDEDNLQEGLAEAMAEDVQNTKDKYWEQKGDEYREKGLFRDIE